MKKNAHPCFVAFGEWSTYTEVIAGHSITITKHARVVPPACSSDSTNNVKPEMLDDIEIKHEKIE